VLQQKVAAQGERWVYIRSKTLADMGRTNKLRKQLEKLEHDIDAITYAMRLVI
jgi:hypothetical protein